ELQRELTHTPPPSGTRPPTPAGSEPQFSVDSPDVRSVLTEEMDRMIRELDAVRGERDQLHARQQALSLEAAQLRILVSEFEHSLARSSEARLTAFRGLARALEESQARSDSESQRLQAEAQQRERALIEEVERRIKAEQDHAAVELAELRQEF